MASATASWRHTLRNASATARRHWRRGRARWRLHRMEWNGRLRPLEPPAGYERYYDEKEMFPGLKQDIPPATDLVDFRRRLHLAWLLYKHHYKPDPEMAEIERQLERRQQQALQSDASDFVHRVRHGAHTLKEDFGKGLDQWTDRVQHEIKDKTPHAQRIAKDRVQVLKDALSHFSKGYREGVDGKVDLLKHLQVDDDTDRAFDDAAAQRANATHTTAHSEKPTKPT